MNKECQMMYYATQVVPPEMLPLSVGYETMEKTKQTPRHKNQSTTMNDKPLKYTKKN